MTALWMARNSFCWDSGTRSRDGPLLTPDWVDARYWFEQAAQTLPDAQYALGKLLLTDDVEVYDRALPLHVPVLKGEVFQSECRLDDSIVDGTEFLLLGQRNTIHRLRVSTG